MNKRNVRVGAEPISIEDVVTVAADPAVTLALNADPNFIERIQTGAKVLEKLWRKERAIYGVTTSVGDSCHRRVPARLAPEMSLQLSRMHGCGLGRHFDAPTTRAILLARLVSLCTGFSAVRFQLLEAIAALVNHNILPLIPEEGSVGASGDLTPLSYVAGVVMGQGDALCRGTVQPAKAALRAAGLKPLALAPKEGLAIMNGTSVMTALACLAYHRAAQLSRLSSRLTAMMSIALEGNKAHFDSRLFQCKPHPGQAQVARWIAEDLSFRAGEKTEISERIQDTYAIRCAPHIIGVLADALPWMRAHIETELNSCNDNPLVDPESGDVLHGGNFYGGHIAFAMDSLKTAVANIADLMDRQVALLVDEKRNRGLPLNLSGASTTRLPINHGFKALQIACSAWTAEALKLTMPASVFSRSTESHNQDKVSMGTIAARDCLRILELTEQVAAASLLAAAQAIDLRQRQRRLNVKRLTDGVRGLYQQLREIAPMVDEDRPLEFELRQLLRAMRAGKLKCDWSGQ